VAAWYREPNEACRRQVVVVVVMVIEMTPPPLQPTTRSKQTMPHQRLLQPSEEQAGHDALFAYDLGALRGGFRSLVESFPPHFLHCYAGALRHVCVCSCFFFKGARLVDSLIDPLAC
jgi:hypothetical protein